MHARQKKLTTRSVYFSCKNNFVENYNLTQKCTHLAIFDTFVRIDKFLISLTLMYDKSQLSCHFSIKYLEV